MATAIPMGIGILILVVLICSFGAQLLLIPIAVAHSLHLPAPLWLGTLQTWLGLVMLLLVAAWLLGDR